MTEPDDIDELDLLALADGGLDDDPARKTGLEANVARCPRASARLAAYRAQTVALRAAYAGALAEPVPRRLYDVLERDAKTRARPVVRSAMAGLMVAAAGLGGWLIGEAEDDPARQALLDESYRQFVLNGPEQQALARQTGPAATERAINWGDDDVAIRLAVPDLSAEGFALTAKRGLREGEDRLVVLDYTSRDGRAFSLFIAPRWTNRPGPIVEERREGVTLAYWHDGPLAASLATGLPRDQARQLAEQVRRAMRDDTTAPPPAIEPEFRPLAVPRHGEMADNLEARPAGRALDAVPRAAPAALGGN
ncbi:anti-sigma factor family protein [Rhodovulum steppense]|uniref:Anti-sigma factor RsiW n=1 Tax=Rhodovulum steppense TaxID=540251 RepID=A0A4R1YTG0_9RHOB|nr:anti-sigma factor [Rhodovulum steppense]TCM82724.1 anti-sigma factor RsiW [Rhodovulum steppense]